MGISTSDYSKMQARLKPKKAPGRSEVAERDLHAMISEEIARRGWYCIHSRMDKPSRVGIGTPDFVVAADHGLVFWIEVKRKGNKESPAQRAAGAWLTKLGHVYAVVHSVEEFIEVIRHHEISLRCSRLESWLRKRKKTGEP